MSYAEKLATFIAKASGLSMDEVASLVKKEDGSVNLEGIEVFDKAEAALAAKLKALRTEVTAEVGKSKFDEGFSKAKRETAETFEKSLKDKFGIEEALKGDDLINAVFEKAGKEGDTPTELTQEVVEKSPFYLRGVQNAKKQAEEERDKIKDEFEKFKSEQQKASTMSQVWDRATSVIDGLNLQLSEDPARRKAQLGVIQRELQQYGFTVDGDTIGVMKDGKLLKDDTENPVDFKKLVEQISLAFYDQAKGKPRNAPTVKDDDKGDKTEAKWTRDMPKNNDEYLKAMTDETIPVEERKALEQTWEAEHGG